MIGWCRHCREYAGARKVCPSCGRLTGLRADGLAGLEVTDGRTPEQLKADGDARWPDGTRYTPPHLTGEERRRFVELQEQLDRGQKPAGKGA